MSEELEPIPEDTYKLMSIKGVVESANNIRKHLLSLTTDKYYLDSKNGFVYIKGNYMDNLFKSMYPIHRIELIKQEVIANAWVTTTVEIKAYLSPSIYISNLGSGAARLQIPKEYNDRAKALKADGKMVERLNFLNSLSPIDWIDVGNDFKSSLSKAISNAQSRFGVGADIYNKEVLPPEYREKYSKAIEDLISKATPMEQIRLKKAWDECKVKKSNIYTFYKKLAAHLGFTEDSEMPN